MDGMLTGREAEEAAQRAAAKKKSHRVNGHDREAGEADGLFRSVRDLVMAEPAGWHVKGLIQRGTFVLVVGKPKTGKSFLVTDCMLALARGLPFWFGYKVPRPARVLYVNAEGSMTLRLRAYLKHHGLEDVPGFTVITQRVRLNAEGAAKLIAAVEEHEAEHGTFDVVVIDTVARALVGSESSDEDMAEFVAACERLVGGGRRTVIAVHHVGKDATRGARGHSSLPAAVATQIDVESDGSGRAFRVELQRDAEADLGRAFRLQRVVLGTDEDGDELASVVVAQESDAVREPRPARPKGKNQAAVLSAIRELMADEAEVAPGTSTLPAGKRIVRIDAVIRRASPAIACDARHKHSRITDALNGLRDGGFIGISDPWVWTW